MLFCIDRGVQIAIEIFDVPGRHRTHAVEIIPRHLVQPVGVGLVLQTVIARLRDHANVEIRVFKPQPA
jgi:hypothetical protein